MPLVLDSDLQANSARELDAHIQGLLDDPPPAPLPMPVPADQADRQAAAAPLLPASSDVSAPPVQTSGAPSLLDQLGQHVRDLISSGGAAVSGNSDSAYSPPAPGNGYDPSSMTAPTPPSDPAIPARPIGSQPQQPPEDHWGLIGQGLANVFQHVFAAAGADGPPISPVPAPGGGYDPSSMTGPTPPADTDIPARPVGAPLPSGGPTIGDTIGAASDQGQQTGTAGVPFGGHTPFDAATDAARSGLDALGQSGVGDWARQGLEHDPIAQAINSGARKAVFPTIFDPGYKEPDLTDPEQALNFVAGISGGGNMKSAEEAAALVAKQGPEALRAAISAGEERLAALKAAATDAGAPAAEAAAATSGASGAVPHSAEDQAVLEQLIEATKQRGLDAASLEAQRSAPAAAEGGRGAGQPPVEPPAQPPVPPPPAGQPASDAASSGVLGSVGQVLGAPFRAIANTWAPGYTASTGVQDALSTLDSSVRGGLTHIDTLVRRGEVNQFTAQEMSAELQSAARKQFVNDVANADGAMQKWAPGEEYGPLAPQSKPPGWVDGSRLSPELEGVWLSPQSATAVKNYVGRNDSVPVLSGLANIAGLPKEIEMGGSPFHALSMAKLNFATNGLIDGARIEKQALANWVSPASYNEFRLATADNFEQAARDGVTQLQDPFEGESIDLASLSNRLRSLPVRTILGGLGGAAKEGVRYGPGGAAAGGIAGAADGALSAVLSPGMWQRYVPTIKVMTYEQLSKSGVPGETAAKITNTMFGGENKVRIAQAAWVSTAARVAAFAPDWWASELKTMGGVIGKGAPAEVAAARKAVISRILIGEMLHEGLNWALTGGPNGGHFSWDNAPGHQMDVQTNLLKPTNDAGQPQQNFIDGRLLFEPRDYDLLKLATEAIRTRSGEPALRFLGNRLSAPLSQAVDQGANTQYTGLSAFEPPIVKKGEPPLEQAGRRLAHLAGIVAPAGATTPIESYEAGGAPAAVISGLTGGRVTSTTDAAAAQASRGGTLAGSIGRLLQMPPGQAPAGPVIRGPAPRAPRAPAPAKR